MAPRKSPPVSFARESYPPGGAGPSPPLYGPDFLTIPSQNFLESKTELEATEMNPRTAMICIACARISDRDVVDAGRGTK